MSRRREEFPDRCGRGESTVARTLVRGPVRPAALSLRAAERRQGPGHRAVRRPGGTGGLLDRHPVRPAARRGAGSHGHVGYRAGLPDVAGFARLPAGRGRMDPAALRRRRRPRPAGGGLRGHEGVRGHHRPVPASAHARTGTRSCIRPCPTRPTPWGRPWPGPGRYRVPELAGGGPDLDAVDPADAARALAPVGELAVQSDGRP